MSEQQHTKEPWANEYRKSICGGYAKEIFDASGITIASIAWYPVKISPNTTGTNGEANARRIVAAVNACAGIHTDYLEQCPSGGLFNLVDYSNELVKQRDDLLAALEGARESLDAIRLAVEPYDDIKPRDWKSDRANLRDAHTSAKETIEAVDTAIASVKDNTK